MRLVLLTAILLTSTALSAWADKRVALVFGQDKYDTLRPLENAGNDAEAVEDALDKLGFEVSLETNRDLKRMRRALEDFQEDAAGADVALVYFAGHGVEVAGQNMLLPTDADASSADALKQSSMPVEEIRTALAKVSKVNLVLLDACRNDPFGGAGGGTGRGAVALNPTGEVQEIKPGLGRLGNAENLLYTFSAAPGATAADGTGDNSPFTEALVKYLGTDGLEIRSVMTLVQQEVYDLSRGGQLPYVENGLPEVFFAATEKSDLPERERLLLAMADVNADLRDEVERLAREKDMPLAPLYGALISSDAQALSIEDRRNKLTEAANAFVATREQIKTMASSDPQVAALRDEAEKQLGLGAFDTARGKLDEAAKIDSTSRDALKANFTERTISEASTHIIAGGASRTNLKYELAIDSFGKATALFGEVGGGDLSANQRAQQLGSLETLGDLYLTVGNLAEGRKAFEQQQAVAKAMEAKEPSNAAWQANLAASDLKLGDVLRDQGDSTAALASYEQGLAIRKALAAANPTDVKVRAAAAAAWLQIGALQNLQGNNDKALAAYEESRLITSSLVDSDRANEEHKVAIARLFLLKSEAQYAAKDLDDAALSANASVQLAKQLTATKPDDAQRQFALVNAYLMHAKVLEDFYAPGDGPENSRITLNAFSESAAILDRLISVDPKNAAYQRAHAAILEGNALATRFSQTPVKVDFDKVRADLKEAVAIREKLAAADPTNKLWIGDLAASYANVSTYYSFNAEDETALDYTKKAQGAALLLAALDPKNVDWQRKAWGYYAKISESNIQLKRIDEARKAEEEGLAFAEKLVAANPELEGYRQDVAVMQDRLTRVYFIQKDWDARWALMDKRLADASANEKLFPNAPWAQRDVFKTSMLSANSWVRNDPKRALELYEQARRAAAKAIAVEPDDGSFPSDITNRYLEFGGFWERAGDRANARLVYEAALENIDQAEARQIDVSKISYGRSHVQKLIDNLREGGAAGPQ